MKRDAHCFSLTTTVLCLILLCGSGIPALAQQPDVSIEVEINETSLASPNVDIQSVIVQDGQGFELYRLFISNDDLQERAEDLYLSVQFRSDKEGLIFSRDQIDFQSFSLAPGQKVFVTSNTIQDGFPGIEEDIFFEGSFTPEGQKFYNRLKGMSLLPHDRYVLRFSIYYGNSRRNGGTLIATSSAEFGLNIINEQNLYLIYPGDVIGYETEISNRYPNFVWQGPNELEYRLIVVEARENESAESLMGGAISSNPIQPGGSSVGGELLEYEMLDVVVDRTGFQYPNSGVPDLEPGKTYYWQIISQLNARDRDNNIRSEIWSFTLSDDAGAADAQLAEELAQILRKILGERYNQLERQGAGFQSIELDGKTYEGAEALQALLRLGDRLDQDEISIVIEE